MHVCLKAISGSLEAGFKKSVASQMYVMPSGPVVLGAEVNIQCCATCFINLLFEGGLATVTCHSNHHLALWRPKCFQAALLASRVNVFLVLFELLIVRIAFRESLICFAVRRQLWGALLCGKLEHCPLYWRKIALQNM